VEISKPRFVVYLQLAIFGKKMSKKGKVLVAMSGRY
jgi:hypothetical protein